MTTSRTGTTLPSLYWKVAFPSAVAIVSLVGLMVSGDVLPLNPAACETLTEYVVLLVTAIIFTHVDAADPDLPTTFVLFAVLFVPATMMFSDSVAVACSYLFYFGLALACLIEALPGKDEERAGWEVCRRALMSYWFIAGSLLTLASVPFLRHPRPLISAGTWGTIMDVRILLSIGLGTLFCGAAVHEVTHRKRPVIPDLPRWSLQPIAASPTPSLVMAFLRPVSIVVMFLASLAWVVLNLSWKIAAEAFVHISRFAEEFWGLVIDEFFEARMMELLRITTALSIVLFMFWLTDTMGPRFVNYANADGHALPQLLTITLFAIVLVSSAVAVYGVFANKLSNRAYMSDLVATAVSCSTMLMFVFATAGGALFIAGKFEPLGLVSYSRLGPFTLVMVALVSLMSVYHIAREVHARVVAA